ncbi:MAG: hypothetical protein U5L11_07755 [Arhodomonas sp.]|nr:hypothetical protein [Arhodomonas sp.]
MDPQQYCRDRVAPPGSSLHYALLFAPDGPTRAALLAVNAVHAELTAIPVEVSDPGVARAKIDWVGRGARAGPGRHRPTPGGPRPGGGP